ncbi:MAG: nucleotide pyrophosphatase/phosphodiesterase family protein [Thermodesulfobacteriota bacterium]
MNRRRRVVVLDVVGLTRHHFDEPAFCPNLARLREQGLLAAMAPCFPAVTLPVQATLTTGLYPGQHGVVANGFFFRSDFRVAFWEQAASLVAGDRLWQRLRHPLPDLKTALLFMQNSLFSGTEVILTPRPLHTDDGLIPWCHSMPVGLYDQLAADLGPFPLQHYWGPLAGIASSQWISRAAAATIHRFQPDLTMVYLPHLDYACQRLGPGHPAIREELAQVDAAVGGIVAAVQEAGLAGETVFVVLAEYAFSEVAGAVFPNRILREHGLLAVRTIAGREYLDLENSRAWAMVDHQVAHLFVQRGAEGQARAALERTPGIDLVLDRIGKQAWHLDHPRAGELVAVANRDRWLAYPWWEDPARAPDFAGRVDIHRKPGYDPCELFFDPETRAVSQDTGLVRGSHGYPPLSERDQLPFLVAGALEDGAQLPERLPLVAVAGVLERLLLTGRP